MASSIQYGDTCGAGTPYGCKRGIPDGEMAHIIVNARKPFARGETRHVMFHIDNGNGGSCCPCKTHPERVEQWPGTKLKTAEPAA